MKTSRILELAGLPNQNAKLLEGFTKTVDRAKTFAEADRIEKMIKDRFGCPIKRTVDKNNYITFELNNDYIVPKDKDPYPNDPKSGALTVKNLSSLIDKDFYEFRRKGWYFSQPTGGVFTIGVFED